MRCATATLFAAVIGSVPERLISARVAPALVTLASDPDVYVLFFLHYKKKFLSRLFFFVCCDIILFFMFRSVKSAAVPTFGKLIISTTTKEVCYLKLLAPYPSSQPNRSFNTTL